MKRDGGPAFPRPHSWDDAQEGMTLRDFLACHAPPYPFAPAKIDPFGDPAMQQVADPIAEWRYAFADAMLAERAKE